MTKDELINHSRNILGYSDRMTKDLIDAYDLGAAAEREACAAVCEAEICACCWNDEAQAAAEHLAETIRIRSNA